MVVEKIISDKSEEKVMNLIPAKKDSSEWRLDTKGYFLIDPRFEDDSGSPKGVIYAHFYLTNRTYKLTIRGNSAEEIYYTILREGLVSSLMHASYLGSELQKAELWLRLKNSSCGEKIEPYVQDDPLKFV